jgi:Tfp pilus assembly protein PilE
VVVIIGILAAIAIPKFSATREKAYFAAMKSDLKNLASQEEIYYADNYSYSTTAADLGFVSSDGVTVTIGEGTASGWSASATHAAFNTTTDGCSVYYGAASATTLGSPTAAGEIACTQ